jgi:hypothetical protein
MTISEKIQEIFEDNNFFVGLIIVIFYAAAYLAIEIGFYSLVVYVTAQVFDFSFKWIYGVCLFLWVGTLSSIFKTKIKES